jgi:hypothetical protein
MIRMGVFEKWRDPKLAARIRFMIAVELVALAVMMFSVLALLLCPYHPVSEIALVGTAITFLAGVIVGTVLYQVTISAK